MEPKPVLRELLRVDAVSLADRIVLKELAGQRVAADCIALPAGAGQAFVFRYGCIVFFDAAAEDQRALRAALEGTLRDRLAQPETESAELPVLSEQAKTAEGELLLPNRELETLQIVADVLAKSVVLAHYESKVADAFDKVEPFAEHLKRTGRISRRSRVLVQRIADGLLTQHRLVGRIALTESPDLLWEHPELERLHTRLADEYELRERAAALERKLQLLSETAQVLLDMLQNRRSLRVEWYIVALILFEIVLSLYRH